MRRDVERRREVDPAGAGPDDHLANWKAGVVVERRDEHVPLYPRLVVIENGTALGELGPAEPQDVLLPRDVLLMGHRIIVLAPHAATFRPSNKRAARRP